MTYLNNIQLSDSQLLNGLKLTDDQDIILRARYIELCNEVLSFDSALANEAAYRKLSYAKGKIDMLRELLNEAQYLKQQAEVEDHDDDLYNS